MRNKPEKSFLSIFQEASKLLKLHFDSDIIRLRTAKKQIHS